jgi:hypothetical protein
MDFRAETTPVTAYFDEDGAWLHAQELMRHLDELHDLLLAEGASVPNWRVNPYVQGAELIINHLKQNFGRLQPPT